ncbi:MAG: DUF3822 family protein [Saprospiraceae bacterium]|nr:DUF3822 family protein [Saprospiraceae bacterium]
MIDLYYKTGLKPTTDTTLSVLFGTDSAFYCIFDAHKVLFEGNHMKIDAFWDAYERGSIKADRLKLMSLSNKFILSNNTSHLPSNDFDVYIDKFTDQPIYCKHIFAKGAPKKVQHIVTALDHHYYLGQKTVFHLYLEINRLHVYYKLDGKFEFYNNYEIKTSEDLLYYVELVHNMIVNGNKERNPLEVSGLVDIESGYLELLKKYYPQITFITAGINAENEPLNQFYFGHLINLACV